MNGMNVIVHKFGGAALRDAAAIKQSVAIVASHRDSRNVVVTSALAGVTDALLAAAMHAVAGHVDCIEEDVELLRRRHLDVLRDLDLDLRWLEGALSALDARLRDIRAAAELTPALTDEILAYGERMSATIFAAALSRAAIPADVIDGAELIQTDGRFGNAAPDLKRTKITLVPGVHLGVSPL